MSLAAHYAGHRASGHYLMRPLRAPRWAWRLAVFALILLIVTVLMVRWKAVEMDAFFILLALIAAMATISILLSLLVVQRVWRRGEHGGGTAVAAMALSLPTLLPFVIGAYFWQEMPKANWAMTGEATGIPPISLGAAGPARAVALTPAPVAAISGRRFEASATEIYSVAEAVARNKGWQIVNVSYVAPSREVSGDRPAPLTARPDLSMVPLAQLPQTVGEGPGAEPATPPESDDYAISAVVRDFLLGFPSEVVIHIREVDGETLVDMRAASLVLPYDLGRSRYLIQSFLSALDDAAAGIEGVAAAK